jgi:hypothetical protein
MLSQTDYYGPPDRCSSWRREGDFDKTRTKGKRFTRVKI